MGPNAPPGRRSGHPRREEERGHRALPLRPPEISLVGRRFVDISKVASPEIVLGIDLGTTFSSAAAWIDGKVYTVPDMRGEPCIPSIVYFAEGGVPVVGTYAERMTAVEPANTVTGIKMILGRRFDSPEVRRLQALSAVQMDEAPNGTVVLRTRGGEHTPVQVAAHIFQHLKELAEARFRLPVRKAVLTLPATATQEVEEATLQAARAVGLDVLETLPEPVAGALAYRTDQYQGRRKVLAYDFGGGTFDVTILDQEDAQIHPQALGGDSCLGGDDFDYALSQIVSKHVWRGHRVDLTRDAVVWQQVRLECEKLKRALSRFDESRLRVRDAFTARGQRQDLNLEVHRADVEPHWAPLVERSLTATAQVMRSCRLRPADLDLILLIGGTTYVPLVRDMLARLLKQEGQAQGDPQIAVAWGAAVRGARVLSRAA